MLDKIVGERWLEARAVIGFWPANARRIGEHRDVVTHRRRPVAVLHTLRQQLARREGRANVALADFIAPLDAGVPDHLGGFAVTAGIGEDAMAQKFKDANHDYSAILVKA